MNRTTLTVVALVVCSILVGCNRPVAPDTSAPQATYTPTPAPADLEMIDLHSDIEVFELPFHSGPETEGMCVLTRTWPEEKGIRVELRWADGTVTPIACDFWEGNENKVALVDLYAPSDQAIVLFSASIGTGGYGVGLTMINPKTGQFVELDLTQVYNPMNVLTKQSPSANYDKPQFAAERAYLEELKYTHGFCTDATTIATESDPFVYAVHRWGVANGEITEGVMRTERIPGQHRQTGNPATVLSGPITYSAFFKGAVWAYDADADESFVVFCADIPFITEIYLDGDWLLIDSDHEGLAIVNVTTWQLRRLGIYVDEVTDFAVNEEAGTATINDFRVDLPPILR